MHLKSLTILGFKSFAQRATLEFAPGITAVVGPNGSGKSNVSDAVRWALGEQSMKSLRGRKGEDLVFAGSEGRQRASMAEVTLVLDNSDGSAPVPAAEISLTRRLYRSGEAEYLLGGKPARLLDVVTLLAEAGFGQSTYTVISQGMIDSLLMGSASERKALFDEAVGVRSHYLKRDQSVRRLTHTRENLDQVRLLLRELEPTLASLSRSAKRAAERGEVETKLRETTSLYYGSRLGTLERRLAQVEAEQVDQAGETERLEREAAALEVKLATLSVLEDPELERESRSLRELSLQRDELTRKLALADGRLQAAKEQGGDLELRSTLDTLERFRAEQSRLAAAVEDQSSRAKKAEERLAAAEAERDRLRDRGAALQDELAKLEESLAARESSLLVSRARELVALIKSAPGEIIAHLGELESTLAELERSLDPSGTSELQAVRRSLREHESVLRRAESKSQELFAERASATSLLLAAKDRLGEIERELAGLEARAEGLGHKGASPGDALTHERDALRQELSALEAQIKEAREAVSEREGGLRERMRELGGVRSKISEKQSLRRSLEGRSTELQVERAKLETKLEDLRAEVVRELGATSLADLPRGELTGENLSRTEAELARLRNRLATLGTIDPETAREYEELEGRVRHLSEQASDLETAAADLEKVVADLDQLIKRQFAERFHKIAAEFETRFQELFGGGRAQIELTAGEGDEMGIEIRATPPGKRLSEIASLSGGERSLTSAALLCAILTVNPSPFVVLDEVDAALDEVNTVKFGQVLSSLAHHTQFILITHNRRTMELASVLYGVTMDQGGVSRILSLRLEEAEELAEAT